MLKSTFWTRLVPLLASVNLAAGSVAFFIGFEKLKPPDPSVPFYNHLVFLLPLALTGGFLFLGGHGDRRAVALGSFFLAVATSQCNRPLRLVVEADYAISPLFAFINAIELDCFIAFYLWRFVRDFPAPVLAATQRRFIDLAIRASGSVAIFFMTVNFLRYLLDLAFPGSRLHQLLVQFGPLRGGGLYYGVILAMTAPAFVFLWWKALSSQEPDQQRVRLFLQGLVLGFGPLLIETLTQFFPPYSRYIKAHDRFNFGMTVLTTLPMLTVPFLTYYAVLLHRVMDVKLIARRAFQYALARYSALALAATPIAALLWYLYRHSDSKVGELFAGSRVLILIAASIVGGATLHYRKTLLDSIDRRFFREQYDARQILTLLVERIRSVNDTAGLSALVSREIDIALHLEGIALLVLDPRSNVLSDPRNRTRKLDGTSKLAHLISNASDPLDIDLEDPRTPLANLPSKERHWVVDSGFRLIVPILARNGELLGMIGLGEKKSGLPFLREDRQLLHAIASSAAWVLELDRPAPPERAEGGFLENPVPPTSPMSPIAAAELAKECPHCHNLYQPFTIFCSSDSRRLEPAHVPYVLPGKFRFEKRIGTGGMGVVYRGADLALGRPVAVKTLRRVSPEDAMRLRREARTAAAVAHPHLAAVYGMETWQGTPILILELLEGGTLAQRLEKGKLEPLETVELGISMAEALAQLHAADILHRDIKPSNIGYTRDGLPKLMDFGIARLIFDLRREEEMGSGGDFDESSLLPPTSIWNETHTSITNTKQLVGTLSYLSPEALNGRPADASFDLWGLSIVLYECLLGRKIFTGAEVRNLMNRIKAGRVPDFAQVCPEHDPILGDFFRSALHPTLARRPTTALELKQRLQALRGRLVA